MLRDSSRQHQEKSTWDAHREDSPDDAEIPRPHPGPAGQDALKTSDRGIKRKAGSAPSESTTFKRPNTNLEVSSNNYELGGTPDAQNKLYSPVGFSDPSDAIGNQALFTARSMTRCNLQPIFVNADLPPELSEDNLSNASSGGATDVPLPDTSSGAMEDDDCEMTMEDILAARQLMQIGENAVVEIGDEDLYDAD